MVAACDACAAGADCAADAIAAVDAPAACSCMGWGRLRRRPLWGLRARRRCAGLAVGIASCLQRLGAGLLRRCSLLLPADGFGRRGHRPCRRLRCQCRMLCSSCCLRLPRSGIALWCRPRRGLSGVCHRRAGFRPCCSGPLGCCLSRCRRPPLRRRRLHRRPLRAPLLALRSRRCRLLRQRCTWQCRLAASPAVAKTSGMAFASSGNLIDACIG